MSLGAVGCYQAAYARQIRYRTCGLAYNLVRLLMAQAALDAGVHPRQLSFKHTVQLWAEWTAHGVDLSDDPDTLFRLIAQPTVGNRPGRIAIPVKGTLTGEKFLCEARHTLLKIMVPMLDFSVGTMGVCWQSYVWA